MSKRLRYQMIKSSQQRVLSQRRVDRINLEFSKEVELIEGKDPLCTQKKNSKNTSKLQNVF